MLMFLACHLSFPTVISTTNMKRATQCMTITICTVVLILFCDVVPQTRTIFISIRNSYWFRMGLCDAGRSVNTGRQTWWHWCSILFPKTNEGGRYIHVTGKVLSVSAGVMHWIWVSNTQPTLVWLWTYIFIFSLLWINNSIILEDHSIRFFMIGLSDTFLSDYLTDLKLHSTK